MTVIRGGITAPLNARVAAEPDGRSARYLQHVNALGLGSGGVFRCHHHHTIYNVAAYAIRNETIHLKTEAGGDGALFINYPWTVCNTSEYVGVEVRHIPEPLAVLLSECVGAVQHHLARPGHDHHIVGVAGKERFQIVGVVRIDLADDNILW